MTQDNLHDLLAQFLVFFDRLHPFHIGCLEQSVRATNALLLASRNMEDSISPLLSER